MKFTHLQLVNWRAYEEVRSSGDYNMISPDAVIASGLSKEDYFFSLKNYTELKQEAERIGE